MSVKNGRPDGLVEDESQGFGVRVVVDGAWGFASSSRVEPREIERVARRAVEIARASALVLAEPVELGEPIRSVASYATPVQIDPFSVAIDEKLAALLEADAAMRAVRGIAVSEGSFECQRISKTFASTEGSYVEQTLVETGAGIEALAVGEDDAQRRSFPNSFGRQHSTAGYEYFKSLDLAANARRTAEEAVKLLTAKPCPDDVTTVILDSSQAALQVHESCGHPIELDRVFGTEASYAGTSFLTLDKRGGYRYGSDARHHRRRRDDPRRARHLRLRRRGRPGPAHGDRGSRHLQELPDLPRDGRAASGSPATARCAPTAGAASR